MRRSALFLTAQLCSLVLVGVQEADAGGWNWKKARRSFKKRVKEVDQAARRLKNSKVVVKTRRELDRAGQSTRDTARSAQRHLGFGYRTRRKPTQVAQLPSRFSPPAPAAAVHGPEKPPVKRAPTPVCVPPKPAPC